MAGIFSNKIKGAKVPGNKNTANKETVIMSIPDEVSIVFTKHMGVICDVLVKPNDQVCVGTIIGDSENKNSVPIHSSVSGNVKLVDDIELPDGSTTKKVVITTDKKQTIEPLLSVPQVNDFDGFIKAVRDSGMVGLGGAGFPTHVKFNSPIIDKIDSLLINAAECEPYLTSDTRTMIEQTDDLFEGISLIMKHMDLKQCIIGVESNKPEAIDVMLKRIESDKLDNVKVAVVAALYPQGAEKVLIKQAFGKTVMEGKLPADVGVTIINVTTAAELGRFFRDGIPLVNKRVTVDGSAVTNPQNVLAPIGTHINDLMDFCGGYKDTVCKIIMGGPMMGITIEKDTFPLLKNNNGILAFAKKESIVFDETSCIRCGACSRVCPMNLVPFQLKQAYEREDADTLKLYKINLCIECGNCSFVCPAQQELVKTHRKSKQYIFNLERGKK